MERLCQKCKEPVPQEAFLCPHCGAILDSSAPKPVEEKPPKARNIPYRHILSVILALLFVVAAVVLISSVLKQIGPKDPTVPTQTTVPPTTTEPAPLVPYEVKVLTDQRDNLKGILVMVCKDGEVLYTCESGSYGSATFILPQADGYTIRLAQLPEPYQTLYGTGEYAFESEKQVLEIVLETKNVPYTVRVVNREGEPLSDTLIQFYGSANKSTAVTDEHGFCSFEDKYVNSGYRAGILSYPTGYCSGERVFRFDAEKLVLTIVLDRYEEIELQNNYRVYKVRVEDESGAPIAGLHTSFIREGWMVADGYTNSDGVFAFVAIYKESPTACIMFLQNVDYSHLQFVFPEGSQELEITLPGQNTSGIYTYQLYVHDQYERPIVGAEVAYQWPDGTVSYFTSDEEGYITMELTEVDPTKVTVMLSQVPEGYDESTISTVYTFNQYSRVQAIAVMYMALTPVTINVVDQYGDPVVEATLAIRDEYNPSDETRYITDANGVVQLELDPMVFYYAWIYDCPRGYSSDDTFLYLYAQKTEYTFVLTRLPHETYTVKFQDEQGNPVSGVSILVDADIYPNKYTSDENGVVTFEVYPGADSEIWFFVRELPEGYVLQDNPNPGPDELIWYSIPIDVTTMVVLLVLTD